MILIGQYDSSFTRRVGIALRLYGIPFEHRPWSIFGDPDKIRQFSPLTQVPTLVLDDGTALVESHMMLDYIDSLVPAEARLFPVAEPARHRALRIAALATGMGGKSAALFYEVKLHAQVSQFWVDRCRAQVFDSLALLDRERAARPGDFWFGDRIGHADIAVATVLRHMGESHPGLFSLDDYPALRRHAAFHEALPVFQEISQPFIPPA
ncbi:MAG: glutathione S-transferase family protein [Rhizobiaceae bacterium]|nr:glutathione S-transferase family protein [Rhizobiaceae bacterium]